MELSAQMREVLLLTQTHGRISVKELIRHRIARGMKRGVAKASLSRTLRRLWRLGLIELHTYSSGYRFSATERQLNAQRIFERVLQNPRVEYRQFKKHMTSFAAVMGGKFTDPYGSASAFLATKQRAFMQCPRIRARYIETTAQGEQTVNSLAVKRS
jgi:hypothetical protein